MNFPGFGGAENDVSEKKIKILIPVTFAPG